MNNNFKNYDKDDSLKELHQIREKNYEETKEMTPSEFIDHIHKQAEPIIKKYNLAYFGKN